MPLLELLIGAAALALLAPVLILAAEVAAALFAEEHAPAPPAGTRPRVAVLIPAHDEGSGIGDTLRALIPQLRHGDRLLVVADNCADDTAAVAATEGAEVIVRSDR